jgi:hypothetical protein
MFGACRNATFGNVTEVSDLSIFVDLLSLQNNPSIHPAKQAIHSSSKTSHPFIQQNKPSIHPAKQSIHSSSKTIHPFIQQNNPSIHPAKQSIHQSSKTICDCQPSSMETFCNIRQETSNYPMFFVLLMRQGMHPHLDTHHG